MARLFLSFTFALATATLILFGAGATPASAQAPKAGASAAATAPVYQKELSEAFQLFLGPKHDYPGAIKALEVVVRKYPELPYAHVLMYQILAQVNQQNAAAAARNELEAAVQTNPSDPEPYVDLAVIALNERRVAEAALDLEKAKQLLTTYTNERRKEAIQQQTMSGIALLAESRQDWKAAEALLNDLKKLAPKDLGVHQRLAKAQFYQGQAGDAYNTLKAAKQIDRDNAAKNKTREVFLTPEAIMAQLYDQFEGRSSKTGNAEKWFKAALKLAPDDLPTRQVVAVWALETGNLPFAKEQAEKALKIEAADAKLSLADQKYSGSNVGHLLRGVVALWEKDWPEAERNFKALIDVNPNDFSAKNNMALALVEQDDPAKKKVALAYAEGNYSANNKSPDALSTLGWVHFRRGEFNDARVFLEAALKATGGNMNADTATYVAHILHHQNLDWQAKELLKSALEANRPFSMRPEAEKLYEKVKDATKPADATPAAPATGTTAPKTP